MGTTLDAQSAEDKARELLDNRISSVRELVAARAQLDALQGQIAEAEARNTQAYRAALADGWSPGELRKLGLENPEKKPRGRRKSAELVVDPVEVESEG